MARRPQIPDEELERLDAGLRRRPTRRNTDDLQRQPVRVGTLPSQIYNDPEDIEFVTREPVRLKYVRDQRYSG